MKVLVFKTSVNSRAEVKRLAPALDSLAPGRWNFDLEDQDRILRITSHVARHAVVGVLDRGGFDCAELDDLVPGFPGLDLLERSREEGIQITRIH